MNIFPLLSENTFPIMVNVRYPEGAVRAAYRRRPPPSDPHDVAIAVNKSRLWGNLWSYRGTSNTAYRTKQVHMYRQRNTNITAPGGARGTAIWNNMFYGSHNDMKKYTSSLIRLIGTFRILWQANNGLQGAQRGSLWRTSAWYMTEQRSAPNWCSRYLLKYVLVAKIINTSGFIDLELRQPFALSQIHKNRRISAQLQTYTP